MTMHMLPCCPARSPNPPHAPACRQSNQPTADQHTAGVPVLACESDRKKKRGCQRGRDHRDDFDRQERSKQDRNVSTERFAVPCLAGGARVCVRYLWCDGYIVLGWLCAGCTRFTLMRSCKEKQRVEKDLEALRAAGAELDERGGRSRWTLLAELLKLCGRTMPVRSRGKRTPRFRGSRRSRSGII